METYDEQYKQTVLDVIVNGSSDKDEHVRTKWKDETPAHTKSLISKQMRFDNKTLPILTTKKVAWRSAINELLWIWQMKSNRVQDLRDKGVNIWNEWELEDGTIGDSYGFQLGKKNRKVSEEMPKGGIGNSKIVKMESNFIDQVDYLIDQLKNNPSSRRHITEIWNPDDLDNMSLMPCVHLTQWYVKDNKLHLEVRSRSSDLALGNPFNIFQYNVLQRMIAQVTGYELGEYIFNIGDCHVYDRHIKPLLEQVHRKSFETPTLEINPEVTNFYDFTIDDFTLVNYVHGEKVPMEVAL